jgi:MFS family permease
VRPDLLAVALVASGALAFEVLLARLLAIIHWHHFAGMVISLALLGYGASGGVLAPLRDRLRPHAALAFAGAATLFGTTALAVVAAAQALPFNALEVVWNPRQWLWLALLYLLFAVPFFFAAACTGLALTYIPLPVGRIYRADLLGAAMGALAAVGLLSVLRPDRALPLIAASGPIAAAITLTSARQHRLAAVAIAFGVMIGLAAAVGWPALRISPFKPLPQILLVEGTEVAAERSSPIELVQIVRSRRIPFRSVTGLSLTNRQEPAPQLGLFVDGDGPLPITHFAGDFGPLAYLNATLAALPYRLLDRSPRVLLLGLGGGTDLLLALSHAARSVDVIEPDGSVADLLRNELSSFAGGILARPEVRLHVGAARRFVATTDGEYDLILLGPPAGGRSTLAENFAITVEALTVYLRRLAPGGLLALPHPLRLPPRESLKLALTAIEALKRLGVAQPAHHLALVRAWDSVLLLVRSTPFGTGDLAGLDAFAEELGFDIGWHAGMPREAADRFNILGEPVFFDGMAALTGPDRARFVADYAFDIRPATDDRPYFHDFFRWRALPALWATAREGNAGLLDWGWPVQLATLGIAVLSGLVLILLPARLLTGRAGGRLYRGTGAYFLLIGTGFMFIEIAAMQRLVLLLGDPVHAFAGTLAAFLAFAGMGSGAAARLDAARSAGASPWTPGPEFIVLVIAGFATLHAFAGPGLLAPGGDLGPALQAVLAAAMVVPLAFAMGLPFPLVLARLRTAAPVLLPWAWGVNGCASVIAAVFAGLLAMSFGAQSLMMFGVLSYLLAAFAQRGITSSVTEAPAT